MLRESISTEKNQRGNRAPGQKIFLNKSTSQSTEAINGTCYEEMGAPYSELSPKTVQDKSHQDTYHTGSVVAQYKNNPTPPWLTAGEKDCKKCAFRVAGPVLDLPETANGTKHQPCNGAHQDRQSSKDEWRETVDKENRKSGG